MYILTSHSCQFCHRSTLSINALHSNSNYCESKNQYSKVIKVFHFSHLTILTTEIAVASLKFT